jgi:hypothetical protein
MPGDSATFTPSSSLFRPRHDSEVEDRRSKNQSFWILVEAPGTAPGSEWAYYEVCVSP